MSNKSSRIPDPLRSVVPYASKSGDLPHHDSIATSLLCASAAMSVVLCGELGAGFRYLFAPVIWSSACTLAAAVLLLAGTGLSVVAIVRQHARAPVALFAAMVNIVTGVFIARIIMTSSPALW